MSLNPDIRDQAYQFFIEEAQELLQVLETGLLSLRQDHSTPKVHELMRAAHSIKGGAASVELSAIELLAHRLEDFFKALYSDDVEFDEELEGLLLQGYDCLRNPLTEQIEQGSFDEESALLTAEPVFSALEICLEDALKNSDNYIPSATDLGVDIVSSIFEVDVAQALEHLQKVASNPQNYDPAAELETQLEVFAGFAELFNLPGFSDIIQTAQKALAENPDRVLAIIEATVADCTIAKDLVLAGDRQQGGQVSPALRELAQGTVTSSTTEKQLASNTKINTETNIAGNENVLDSQDNLWSSEAATEALAEDIFGTLPDAEPVLTEAITETAESTDADINDIFGSIPDSDAGLSKSIAESAESTDADINDIFGSIPDAETIVKQTNAEPAESTEADINDIFGSIPEAETTVEQVAGETLESSEADINEIFGTLPDDESAIAESLANDDEELTLSEIFGKIPDTEQPVNAEVVDSLTTEITAKDEALSEDNQQSPPKNIETAVESIAEIYDSLPSIDTVPDALPLPDSRSPAQKFQPEVSSVAESKTAKPKSKAAPKLSVRVDLDRLERMNNLVGELTINRNSLALQNQQLQENVSELGQKFFRFREVTKKLREISDTMLIEQLSNNFDSSIATETKSDGQNFHSQENFTDESTEFDSLEMDSYSTLYSSLQEVLEEIVQLEESVDDITIFAQQSDRTINVQRQMLGQMRDELMWVRMLPLEQILQRFPRTLRDLSTKYQKPVELKLTGTGVLVDRAVLEKLSDPLLHLLRNGFDHGIEDTAIRTNQGKPATGLIEINAYYQGNQTVIEVKDDGKGLDIDKITRKAMEKGLISPQEAASATKEKLFELIFEPGFSTANQVSEISGRGVGMNIVRSQIETLKGKITVTSSPGLGSTFTLRLPLTLTIAKLLVCSLGQTTFAIPSDSIEEIIIPTDKQIRLSGNQKFLSLQQKLVPIYSLREILEYNCPIFEFDSSSPAFKTIAPPDDWLAPLLLLRRGQQLFALEVVNLISEQELVIKPYGKAIAAPRYSYGCTILSDGSLIPAFDGAALISTILGEETEQSVLLANVPAELEKLSNSDLESTLDTDAIATEQLIDEASGSNQATKQKTIMLVDDSTALRRTMALTLEKEGYRVIQKKDGKDALDGFRQTPALDLIICDIEMPTMNGFEFLGMRRRDSALAKIPIVMLTSRSGAKHRNLANQLGANGYFTKPYIEQEFLAEVKKIFEYNDSFVSQTHSNQPAIETKTILVIDDSSALRRTLALSLEQKGYRVLQGRDGVEGLDLLKNNLQTTLVICDVEMPNMNGWEFLTACREDSQLTKIPVVMLTSRDSEKHRNLATGLGVNGYFTKPYIEHKFLQDIDNLIAKYSNLK
ncbi:hybrid sensor histidine kinase/response regulator [Pleurocapsa sp. PCC 7319]|uniref:hybrid sensor histidine kinase/response regulator n=1 Tax=Pleurocapsa sp. PCC 7319 TaxID=118161 RepID=UPI00034C31A4|nr:hybrid sensor histidine kinase/response regulator [Pleurocapsa sp. PCC 7319]